MRNKISTYIIITTLVMALLVSTGKATSVFALADPVQAIAPVFDTQIYQLQDYIDNGGLTDPQLDIFYILTGMLVAGQAGSQTTHLVDPFTNSSSILDWLKSCGIELYNNTIDLIPTYVIDPISGDLRDTAQIKELTSYMVAQMMGNAVVAATYGTLQDFLDDIDNSSAFLVPFTPQIQLGVNTIFGLKNGLYNWQLSQSEFVTTVTYATYPFNSTLQAEFNSYFSTMPAPKVRTNDSSVNVFNDYWGSAEFIVYHNLFFNSTLGKFYICDDNGTALPVNRLDGAHMYYYRGSSNITYSARAQLDSDFSRQTSFNPLNYANVVELVQAVYDNTLPFISSQNYIFFQDFIDHIYYGPSWSNKIEVTNLTDLNFIEDYPQYYNQLPEGSQLDLKGLLQQLVNNTDLTNIILDLIYDSDGIHVTNPVLTRVTTQLLIDYERNNPPIPVNLNDVELYTENDYIEEIKDRGRKFGEVIGQYIIFWHNSDPATCYILLGGSVVVLLAAFIGKWGHS